MAENLTEFISVDHDPNIAVFNQGGRDTEKQPMHEALGFDKVSTFKSLGWLDRFLAVWIFFAMAIGILVGNFVPNAASVLQKGKFVGVSVPIGWFPFDLSLGELNWDVRTDLAI